MAHVQISQGDSPNMLKIVVDGVDLSNHVFREGFGLVQVGDDHDGVWGVRMILAVDPLEIDLPDAVVQALRESSEDQA